MNATAVILAAGHGTRMCSTLPKVLHPLMGQPLVTYSIQAARQATGVSPVLIIGHAAQAVRQAAGDLAQSAIQEPQLGTGHALLQAEALLKDRTDLVLVLSADMPLLSAETFSRLIQSQQDHAGPVTMLTLISEDARGFGRVIRSPEGGVLQIIEEAQAAPDQLAIRELNAGVYCFRADWVWQALRRIPLSPKGEYYLTDVIGIAAADGLPVQAIQLDDPQESIGINTRIHLAEAEAALRDRINRRWMLAGVTMVDPATTYIEPGVTIGQDTTLWPNTHLRGDSVIGRDCNLGPNTIIRDSRLGDHVRVLSSVLEQAVVEDDVDIGPFGHLRKGAHLATGVHMGNFGEVKDSYLGPGTKMGHFSYIGNATIGPQVNIGAGTITCNFDGEKKHATQIGAGVFVGSDTMLVAPIKLGDGSRTGAGSVVTKDVPPDSLAVGVPARVIRKLKKSE